MEDLAFLSRCVRADQVLAYALKTSGWSTTKLGALAGVEQDVLDSIAMKLESDFEGLKVNIVELENLVLAAEEAASRIWSVSSGLRDSDLALSSLEAKRNVKLAARREAREKEIGEKVVGRGTAPRVRWPTRATMLKSAAGDDAMQREMIEKDERGRWLRELASLVENSQTWKEMGGNRESLGLLSRRLGKGRRAGTLRKHVKVWQHYTRWLIAAYSIKWPETPVHFADYLVSRAMEPCGQSIPLSIYKTLIFMEHAAEVPRELQISNSDAIKNALEEVKLQLESNELRPRKQAVQLLVTIVAAMERKVMQNDAPRFVRAFAFYKLMKLWGAMRYHDTTGVDFSSARLDGVAFSANLTRTKTSGPGKKITILKLVIGTDVYVEESNWLETGWRIWEELADESGGSGRDFFLTLPTDALDKESPRMASYAAASGMSQALFKELDCPTDGGKEHLMEMGVGCIWSEHSERVTMRTWASAAGVPEPVCKMLGRWTPTVDQAYDRSVASQIIRAQRHVGEFIRKNFNRVDPFGENQVLEKVDAKMEEGGYHRRVMEVQREKLESFSTIGRPLKRLKWDGSGLDDDLDEKRPQVFVESSSESEGEKEKRSVAVKRNTGLVLGDYTVSTVGRAKTKTLHRLGECYRQPGVRYHEYKNYGSELPGPENYHRACKTCFPKAVKSAASSEEGSSDSDEEASSSSSEGL